MYTILMSSFSARRRMATPAAESDILREKLSSWGIEYSNKRPLGEVLHSVEICFVTNLSPIWQRTWKSNTHN